ncbi:MAG: ImmA/IrrE family metallo-endopeptidase [Clostridiaceae bacterium]
MYKELMLESEEENILVFEEPLNSKLNGLYYEGTITINSKLETTAEKCCVLAEEMGHYHKTHGNILNLKDMRNLKQEKIARKWACERLVPICKLIKAFDIGIHKRYDLAEYLEVTEEFLNEAITHYKEKYGAYREFDDYIIYFEPHLAILKMF